MRCGPCDVQLSGANLRMLGAGNAIAVALADAGVAEIAIFDIALHRAASLAEQDSLHYPICDCYVTTNPVSTDCADLLINCTPIGMAPSDGRPMLEGQAQPVMEFFLQADEAYEHEKLPVGR